MEKRVILAFVLSFVVLYAFRFLYSPPPVSEPPVAGQAPVPPAASNNVLAPEALTKERETPPSSERPQEIRGEKVQELQLETPLYIATVSNVGGVLRSLKLKQYLDGEGQPVELINQQAGDKVGWPLAFVSGDKSVDEQLRTAQFAANRETDKVVLEY